MTQIKYDQHFLKNEDILKEIISVANIKNNDIIFEIGPGQGVLSKKILIQKPKELISVELDDSLRRPLEKIKSKFKNFNLIFGDGVETLTEFNFDKLIANIPYSITEPLYKKLLDLKIDFALLLHGKTFYDTITRRESQWNYYVNAFYYVELICEVNGDDFEPKTKTKSVVVFLKLKSENSLSNFDKFIQILFSKNDRSVKNGLIFTLVDFLEISKKDAKKKILELDISENILNGSFENLSNEDFCKIVERLKTIVL